MMSGSMVPSSGVRGIDHFRMAEECCENILFHSFLCLMRLMELLLA